MSPEEAKTMLCPVMAGPVMNDGRAQITTAKCAGPRCMMWRWSQAEYDAALDAHFTRAIEAMGVKVGDPKSKPTPPQVREAKAAAKHAMADFTPTQGGCGMAGGVE